MKALTLVLAIFIGLIAPSVPIHLVASFVNLDLDWYLATDAYGRSRAAATYVFLTPFSLLLACFAWHFFWNRDP